MFSLWKLLLLLTLVLTGGLLLAAPKVRAAETASKTPFARVIWRSGAFTVTAIEDRAGSMDISLFKGPAAPEERASYFNPQGKTPSSVNVFLIQAGNGHNILVDTGYGDSTPGESRLIATLADLGLKPADIDWVLLTHLHRDHVGGLLKSGRRAFPAAKVFIAGLEREYWRNLAQKDPNNVGAALALEAIMAYGHDASSFEYGHTFLPGLQAVDARGHTPGHTAFMLKTDEKSLLLIGDLLHAAALQFPRPEEYPSYDADPQTALKTRKRLLDLAADEKIPVAGVHIPFTGAGMVRKEGAGYQFTPVE